MGNYTCPRCTITCNFHRQFETFHELRLHVEYDHGMWCLGLPGKAQAANERLYFGVSPGQPAAFHPQTNVEVVPNTQLRLNRNVYEKLYAAGLRLSQLHQELTAARTEREVLENRTARQLQLLKGDNHSLICQLQQQLRVNRILEITMENAYQHERRGRRHIKVYFDDVIRRLIVAEMQLAAARFNPK